jgi:hypothetical protein
VEITAEKLRLAIRHSRKKMETYLRERKAAVQQFVGKHFSDDGSQDKIPIPMLAVAVNIYARAIVARAPRYLVTTDIPASRPRAADFQLVLNQSVTQARLEDTLRAAAKQALFAFALAKTGMAVTSTILTDELTGEQEEVPVGEPFTALVDPDDAVVDMTARTWDEVEFIGHRFRIPLEQLKTMGVYDSEQIEKLSTSADKRGSETRSSDISTGKSTPADAELMPRVDLWEIYVPGTNEIYVLPDDDGTDFLKQPEQWTGPKNPLGPYRFLGLVDAPGQLLPVPPTAWWMDLEQASNAIWRKLIRQGERCKTIGIVTRDPEAAEKIRDASDGEVVPVAEGAKIDEATFGQPDQLLTMLGIKLRSEMSYVTQSDVIGGMAPTSETLGQDRLIHASASQLVDDMQDQMVKFAKDIGHDHAFFQFYHQTREINLVRKLRGYDIGIPVDWNPWSDKGDFLDYQFDIEPYSMRGQTPSQQMQNLMATVNAIMPFMPVLQAEGKTLSGSAFVESISRYTNQPDLTAIIRDIEPVPMPPPNMQQAAGPAKPPQTQRTYVRKNVSEKTRGGQDEAMAQTLMGGAQPKEQGAAAG